MLKFDYDITDLHGAEYNPRKITEEDLAILAQSIKELGIVKPIIVRNKLIVAGHQRTKALLKLGIKTAPVYILPNNVTTYDEIRFNQLHNGTDMDSGDEEAVIEGGFTQLGFNIVESSRIRGNFNSRLAVVRKEICDLIMTYGPWGAVVATKSGEIIHCAQYALASCITRKPLTVYVIEDGYKEKYSRYLNKKYGVFSYDHLKKETYIQSFAQMYRLREGNSEKMNKSTLYETMVIPYLIKNPTARAIDFGSGQGDYALMLRKKGYSIHDVELFRRKENSLNVTEINRLIDKMIRDLERYGPYDVVICDSVMNSIDSDEAETSVVKVLNLLCKMGGQMFISGRSRESVDAFLRLKKLGGMKRYIEFVDDKGYTALYRKGTWFYQKFHTEEQVKELIQSHGFKIEIHERKRSRTSWQVSSIKTREMPLDELLQSIDFEFNLPIGNSHRLNRHMDMRKVVQKLYA